MDAFTRRLRDNTGIRQYFFISVVLLPKAIKVQPTDKQAVYVFSFYLLTCQASKTSARENSDQISCLLLTSFITLICLEVRPLNQVCSPEQHELYTSPEGNKEKKNSTLDKIRAGDDPPL